MSGIGGYGKVKVPKCEGEHIPRLTSPKGKHPPVNVCALCGKSIRNIGDEGNDLWVVDAEHGPVRNAPPR
jgi:hypothetical protein